MTIVKSTKAVACVGETGNSYEIVGRKNKGKRPFHWGGFALKSSFKVQLETQDLKMELGWRKGWKGKMSLKTENWMGGYKNECYRNLVLVYGK